MTPEKEAELFATLAGLGKMLERVVMTQEIQGRTLERVLVTLELHGKMLERLQETQENLAQRVSRVEGRLEEQSNILQVALASRMTRKPAA